MFVVMTGTRNGYAITDSDFACFSCLYFAPMKNNPVFKSQTLQ